MTRGVGGTSPANVQKYLHGIDYPASKQHLLEQAKRNGAPDEVIDTLQRFDEKEFGGPQDVMKSYGNSH